MTRRLPHRTATVARTFNPGVRMSVLVKPARIENPCYRKAACTPATEQHRAGLMAVETVMSAGVLIPIGAALFFLALKAFPYLFAAIQDVVCPPFL